jgi:hypothetical protein
MFQTEVVEKIKTHILCSVTFFSKIMPFMRYVEIFCRVGQATDDNMAHAHCMLDNSGVPKNFIRGEGSTNSVEDRENGDLGAVAP